MLNITANMSCSVTKKLQRKPIECANKLMLTTTWPCNHHRHNRVTTVLLPKKENINKCDDYASRLEEQRRRLKTNFKPSDQLFGKTLHAAVCSGATLFIQIVKASIRKTNLAAATNTSTNSLGNRIQQNHPHRFDCHLYCCSRHTKASSAITETAAAATHCNLFVVRQNYCAANTNKLSHHTSESDSDFVILKAESCANHLSYYCSKFINIINLLAYNFSFNLHTLLNGNSTSSESNRAEYLEEEILQSSIDYIFVANNNSDILYRNNIECKSAKYGGAKQFLRNIFDFNYFKNSDTTPSRPQRIDKMSKVATEQPPIDLSSTSNMDPATTDQLAECSAATTNGHCEAAAQTAAASSSSSSSAGGAEQKKASCFTSLTDIIKFLELVGGLKHTKRTGFVLRDVKNCESISGHMYRMAMMTFLLDGSEGLNQTKCMELALVHDLAECIVGDLTPFCGVTKEDKKRMEMEAMEKICKLIEPRGKRMWELFVEYESGASPESKFVKDLDRLDMVLQAFEYEKRDDCLMKHQEFFDSTEGKFEHGFVKNLVQEIYDQRKSLADAKGCTTAMYPAACCLQNGKDHPTESKTETGAETREASTETSSSPPTVANGTPDVGQQKATNGR